MTTNDKVTVALNFAANVIELFDDATVANGNYMLDSSDCADIIRTLAISPLYAERAATQPAEDGVSEESVQRVLKYAMGRMSEVDSTQQVRDAFDAAFLSANGHHTQAELTSEWEYPALSGIMFRAGVEVSRRLATPISEDTDDEDNSETRSYQIAAKLRKRGIKRSGKAADVRNAALEEAAVLSEDMNSHGKFIADEIRALKSAGNSSAAPSDDLPPLHDPWVVAVRKAEHFCPSELSTPDRWKWKAKFLYNALAASAPTGGSRDKARIDWLIANPNWSIRWRFNAKKKAEQWQMVDDGDSWGQWGGYRAAIDAAIAQQRNGGEG